MKSVNEKGHIKGIFRRTKARCSWEELLSPLIMLRGTMLEEIGKSIVTVEKQEVKRDGR
jgi:hypothetical protein